VCLALFMGRAARTVTITEYADPKYNLCWCPSLTRTELEHGQSAGSAPQGPGVDRDGGERGRAGPFRPDSERTVLPSPESLRPTPAGSITT
jgi:hypothetical protein